jgi:hypothetical protein
MAGGSVPFTRSQNCCRCNFVNQRVGMLVNNLPDIFFAAVDMGDPQRDRSELIKILQARVALFDSNAVGQVAAGSLRQ